jgi:hypothetical protein
LILGIAIFTFGKYFILPGPNVKMLDPGDSLAAHFFPWLLIETMKWVEALKVWNKSKGGKWSIPKKGTKQYDEVRALMAGKQRGGRRIPDANLERIAQQLVDLTDQERNDLEREYGSLRYYLQDYFGLTEREIEAVRERVLELQDPEMTISASEAETIA